MQILLAHGDSDLRNLLRRLLLDDRHVVETATDGAEALAKLHANPGIEALVLDLGLPGIAGVDVARRLRVSGSTLPILALTSRNGAGDRARGLGAGVDDHLDKPFSYEELAAHLRALARRTEGSHSGGVLQNGPIAIDEAKHQVSVGGAPVRLSAREFDVLECLVRHPGLLLSRARLLDAAWPYGVAVTSNNVDAYVHLLRTKLGPIAGSRILTERGGGYRMAEP